MYNNGVKKAGPTYISSRHREYIGQGAHEPTPANQFGLSRNQRVVLSALVAHDNEHTDSWINGSVFNHVPRDSNGNTFAGVLTTSSTSPLPDDTVVPDDIVSPVPSRSVLAPSVALASPVAPQCPMTPPPMSASSASSASSSATESSSSSLSSSRAHYDFRHDRSRAPLPAHENDFNLVDMTPPPRPIPVIAPEIDSDLSDDEYNVQSDSHIITDILLKNQLKNK